MVNHPLFSVLGPVMAGGTPVPSYTTELERRTLRNLPTKGASSGHHSDAPDHIPVQVQLVRKCESTTYPHHKKKKKKKGRSHASEEEERGTTEEKPLRR